jgi:hypothetical protein
VVCGWNGGFEYRFLAGGRELTSFVVDLDQTYVPETFDGHSTNPRAWVIHVILNIRQCYTTRIQLLVSGMYIRRCMIVVRNIGTYRGTKPHSSFDWIRLGVQEAYWLDRHKSLVMDSLAERGSSVLVLRFVDSVCDLMRVIAILEFTNYL